MEAQVLVARQPIFARNMSLFGYELLYRHCAWSLEKAPPFNGAIATTSVIVDGFSAAKKSSKSALYFVNFTGELICLGVPELLPPELCVIEILEDVIITKELVSSVRALKRKGYRFALDDFESGVGFEPLMQYLDFVKVQILDRSPRDIERSLQCLSGVQCKKIAEKIESVEVFDFCKAKGFDLFQGFFLERPVVEETKTLTLEQKKKTRLIGQVSGLGESVRDMATIIKSDPSLVLRFLKYVNSAYFSFAKKIVSVESAVVALGVLPVKKWIYAAILSSMASKKGDGTLVRTALLRAKHAEGLRREINAGPSPEEVFLASLLSMLGYILSAPLDVVLSEMALDPSMANQIVTRQGTLGEWINLVECYDQGDWASVIESAKMLQIQTDCIVKHYVDACNWADCLC